MFDLVGLFGVFSSFASSFETFKTVLAMSASGSLLAIVLLALKPLIRNRLPKSAQYCLWLVVVAALLVPVPKIVTLPGAIGEMPTISGAVQQYVVSSQDVYERARPYMETDGEGRVGLPAEYQEEVGKIAPGPWVLELIQWSHLLSLLGSLAVAGWFLCSYMSYAGSLKRSNSPARSRERQMLAELCRRRTAPELFRNARAATPMLLGALDPVIILPDREYTEGQLRSVLLHELAHLRRKDALIKWLVAAACAIHWFNPVVWLLRREIDRACELACDEAVIRGMDAEGKQAYGDTLIAVAADSRMPRTVLSTTMCERKKSLKERLGAIMAFKKHGAAATAVSAALITAAVLGSCALGAGGGGQGGKIFFAPGERQEIGRFKAAPAFDYMEVNVRFVETSGPLEFTLTVEQEGSEPQQENIRLAETVAFKVSGYVETVVYAEPAGKGAASGNAVFSVSQTSSPEPGAVAPEGATAAAVHVDEDYGFSIEFPFKYGDALRVTSARVHPIDKSARFEITAPDYGIGRIATIVAVPTPNSLDTMPLWSDAPQPYWILGANNVYQFFIMPATDLPLPGTDDPLFAEAAVVFEAVRDAMKTKYEFTAMDVDYDYEELVKVD